jgi:hypothetical protein
MNGQSYLFLMISLILMIFLLTQRKEMSQAKVVLWSVPESKGCIYPTRKVNFTRTEIRHIVPIAQVHKCTYDKRHRLISVSTYNFEKGYQMKKPTEEVLYEWSGYRLTQYSIRKASHGNGEVDVEVYRLTN